MTADNGTKRFGPYGDLVQRIVELEAANYDAVSDYNRCVDDIHEARDRIAELEAENTALKALRALFGTVVRQTIAFRWDSERRHHVPLITVEFAAVASGEPCNAQGWRDRDAFAAAIDAAKGK